MQGTMTDVTEIVQKPTFWYASNRHHAANYAISYTSVFIA